MMNCTMLDMMFNLPKYGLEECPHCHGYGSSLKEEAATCTMCGGSGLVKKALIENDGTNEEEEL